MTPARFRQVRELFQGALEIPAGGRAAFLERGCAGDGDLRAEVDSLLASSIDASRYLAEGVGGEMRALAGSLDTPRAVPRRVGPYMLEREIGCGGMGAVYLAERSDEECPGRVAVKLVKRGMDTDFILRRFRAERQILASLSHPNIARLLDGGTTDDGLPYFVMEYVEGRHLLDYATALRLSTPARVELFRKVCDAVSYAHHNLVVHRDLKPSNILVTEDGTPMLLDFGLAKLVDPGAEGGADASTMAGERMLTPEYASPEHIRGERVTTASDVYSLGVVLYRLLTGQGPFRITGRSTQEVLRAVLEDEPLSARKALGTDLDTILAKALQKDPARRYASAGRLSEDLRRYLDGRPVLARKDTLGYRAGKFVRRHRAGVAAAALAMASLVGGAGAALWQARRAKESEALALRRFADVRALARSVMYELHDGIEPLPGSTPARALLVRTALRYLNRLSEDAGHDADLLRELAEAYERIGDVQGGVAQGNLGDTAGALKSYRRALRTREELAGVSSSVDDSGKLAQSLTRLANLLVRSGDLPGGLSHARRGVGIREELLAKEPGGLRRLEDLAAAVHTLGDTLGQAGDLAAAAEAFTRVAALQQRALVRAPDLQHRRNVAVAHFKIGSVLSTAGKSLAALPHLSRAVAVSEELLAEEPGNARLQRLQTFALDTFADALYESGQAGPAFDAFARALTLREKMVSADPANANLRMHLGILYGRYGNRLATSGRHDQGLAMGSRAVPILEAVAAADPRNVDAAYQSAEALRKLGESTESAATALSPADASGRAGSAATARWAEAAALYHRCLRTLTALRARGALAGLHAGEPEKVAAALARCEAAVTKR